MSNAKTVKQFLSRYGVKPGSLRVSSRPGQINIRLLDLEASANRLKLIAKREFESIDRCSATGDILQGGNTFVQLSYCEKKMAQYYTNEALTAAIEKSINDDYDPSCNIRWAVEQLANFDMHLESIHIDAKIIIYREIANDLLRQGRIKLDR